MNLWTFVFTLASAGGLLHGAEGSDSTDTTTYPDSMTPQLQQLYAHTQYLEQLSSEPEAVELMIASNKLPEDINIALMADEELQKSNVETEKSSLRVEDSDDRDDVESDDYLNFDKRTCSVDACTLPPDELKGYISYDVFDDIVEILEDAQEAAVDAQDAVEFSRIEALLEYIFDLYVESENFVVLFEAVSGPDGIRSRNIKVAVFESPYEEVTEYSGRSPDSDKEASFQEIIEEPEIVLLSDSRDSDIEEFVIVADDETGKSRAGRIPVPNSASVDGDEQSSSAEASTESSEDGVFPLKDDKERIGVMIDPSNELPSNLQPDQSEDESTAEAVRRRRHVGDRYRLEHGRSYGNHNWRYNLRNIHRARLGVRRPLRSRNFPPFVRRHGRITYRNYSPYRHIIRRRDVHSVGPVHYRIYGLKQRTAASKESGKVRRRRSVLSNVRKFAR